VDDASCGTKETSAPQEEEANSSEENWEVEAIIGRRVEKGITQYLVKWKGWDVGDSTWETSDACKGCLSLVRQFNRTLKQRKQSSSTFIKEVEGEWKNKLHDFESPSTSEETTSYEVESIIGKRIRNGKVEYLLKWRNTWERADRCTGCRSKIDGFEREQKSASSKLMSKRPPYRAYISTHGCRVEVSHKDKSQMAIWCWQGSPNTGGTSSIVATPVSSICQQAFNELAGAISEIQDPRVTFRTSRPAYGPYHYLALAEHTPGRNYHLLSSGMHINGNSTARKMVKEGKEGEIHNSERRTNENRDDVAKSKHDGTSSRNLENGYLRDTTEGGSETGDYSAHEEESQKENLEKEDFVQKHKPLRRRRRMPGEVPRNFPKGVVFVSWIIEPGTLRAMHLANTAVPKHILGVAIETVAQDHPCYSPGMHNRRLVAARDFAWGEELGPGIGFCGELVHDGMRSGSRYMAECDEVVSVDAQRYGNELRFINSFKGISEAPNTQFHWRLKPDGMPYLAVVCVVSIRKGEEFLLDYGKPYDNEYLPSSLPEEGSESSVSSENINQSESRENRNAIFVGGTAKKRGSKPITCIGIENRGPRSGYFFDSIVTTTEDNNFSLIQAAELHRNKKKVLPSMG